VFRIGVDRLAASSKDEISFSSQGCRMADEEQVALLKQGVEVWNEWRDEHPDIRPNLIEADLSEADLNGAHLNGADLNGAELSGVDLREADLSEVSLIKANLIWAHLMWTNLTRANLSEADLNQAYLNGANLNRAYLKGTNFGGADLNGADLSGANLHQADFSGANLSNTNLSAADLSEASLSGTVLGNTNLTNAKGLDTCIHLRPSTFDYRTLQQSGPLPLAFLRGVGLPDNLIDYLPSLLNQAIQFYSVFISYSSKDQDFAERLHADLQNKGVRCWFAPHDMPIGAKIIDAIDEAIRHRDKVLLILSENSVASDWVEGEVTRSLDEERERKQVVLFPVRIDDTVMETNKPWTRLLRGQRNIGNFTCWKDHDAYQKVLERLLRDLKVTQAKP
jgi:hypothetical protein